MSQDISRRRLLRSAAIGAGAIGAVLVGACEEPYPDADEATPPGEAPSTAGTGRKQSKEEARYQDMPNGDEHCSMCANFLSPDGCRVIEGPVSPDGWCHII